MTVPPVCCAPPSWCVSRVPSLCPLPQCRGPWPFLFPFLVVLWWFLAPVLCCPRCPFPVNACLLPWASPLSLAAGLSFALSLQLANWWGFLWGADGPCPGMGGLEPPAEGFGGVEAADALDRVPEARFPCLLRHGSLRGGFVRVGGGAGEDFLQRVEGVTPFTPLRFPGPLHPAAEIPQGGGRPPGELREDQGGGRGPRSRSWSGGDGGWEWRMRIGGAGNWKRGAVTGRGGRGHGTAVARVVAFREARAAVAWAGG